MNIVVRYIFSMKFFFGNHGRFGLKPQPDSKMCIYALGIRKSKSI